MQTEIEELQVWYSRSTEWRNAREVQYCETVETRRVELYHEGNQQLPRNDGSHHRGRDAESVSFPLGSCCRGDCPAVVVTVLLTVLLTLLTVVTVLLTVVTVARPQAPYNLC